MDHQDFKFRAQVEDGQDESGVPGYAGGPALDAGRSCVTPGKRTEGYVGGPAASLPDDTQWENTISMFRVRGTSGQDESGIWDT